MKICGSLQSNITKRISWEDLKTFFYYVRLWTPFGGPSIGPRSQFDQFSIQTTLYKYACTVISQTVSYSSWSKERNVSLYIWTFLKAPALILGNGLYNLENTLFEDACK